MNQIIYTSLFSVLFFHIAWGIPESEFQERFYSEIIPQIEKRIEHKKLILQHSINNGDTLSYGKFAKGSRNAFVLIVGRTEYYQKYYETLYDLMDLDYDFYVVDLLGQGQSTRYLKDPQKGYISDYSKYTQSIVELTQHIQSQNQYNQVIGLGHSTGGLVLLNTVEEDPSLFDEIVLVAPLFRIQLSWQGGAHFVLKVLELFKRGENYAPGRGPYRFNIPLEKNQITQSLVRSQINDYFVRKNRQLAIGGPTVRWTSLSIKQCRKIQSKRRGAFRFQKPVHLIQPLKEQIVSVEEQNRVCNKLKECYKLSIENAKHGIFLEKDIYRDQAMAYLRKILQKRADSAY